ncbi:hypothetical protein amrb99_44790 [Actinomadura sp. RB99]|nr:hypothetical protein [Actinomadura sp. RB99]
MRHRRGHLAGPDRVRLVLWDLAEQRRRDRHHRDRAAGPPGEPHADAVPAGQPVHHGEARLPRRLVRHRRHRPGQRLVQALQLRGRHADAGVLDAEHHGAVGEQVRAHGHPRGRVAGRVVQQRRDQGRQVLRRVRGDRELHHAQDRDVPVLLDGRLGHPDHVQQRRVGPGRLLGVPAGEDPQVARGPPHARHAVVDLVEGLEPVRVLLLAFQQVHGGTHLLREYEELQAEPFAQLRPHVRVGRSGGHRDRHRRPLLLRLRGHRGLRLCGRRHLRLRLRGPLHLRLRLRGPLRLRLRRPLRLRSGLRGPLRLRVRLRRRGHRPLRGRHRPRIRRRYGLRGRGGLPGALRPPHRRAPRAAAGRCAPQVIRRFVKAAFFT